MSEGEADADIARARALRERTKHPAPPAHPASPAPPAPNAASSEAEPPGTTPHGPPLRLRRDLFREENLAPLVERMRANGMPVLSAEEREARWQETRAALGERCDVWVFAYGSLMWNPAFEHVEQRAARVRGWHRRFCLWSTFGRGTLERPGLMLALEPGGSCAGLALRIAEPAVESELRIVWMREMITGGYHARIVPWADDEGEPRRALAFVANRTSPRYAGRLREEECARHIAAACGVLGSSRAYLTSLVGALRAHGLRDAHMRRLARLVGESRDGDRRGR